MRKFVLAFIISCSVQLAFGQEKPVTQTEYVKMLYALQNRPVGTSEIVDALRKRGIDFAVTDGIRSLTRSKGANNEDLKRSLEEAERRRQNPVASQPPSAQESAAILENTTKKTVESLGDMPDFVVKQQIQRSFANAGTNNFRNLDRLVVAVSYRSTGEESYKVLSMNGIVRNDTQARRSYDDVGGTSSTGEFVTMLATIFKPESLTKFEPVDSDVIRGRRAVVYDFVVERSRAKQTLTYSGRVTENTANTGMKGRLWIDRTDARVLRIESEATEVPPGFPIETARRTIDYDWVKIESTSYLLPSLSDVRLTTREGGKLYESRNVIRFKEYQKYGTDVKILDDDIKPEP